MTICGRCGGPITAKNTKDICTKCRKKLNQLKKADQGYALYNTANLSDKNIRKNLLKMGCPLAASEFE